MKHYRFVPAKVEVDEHHIGVYLDKKDNRMVKAPHPSSIPQREPGIRKHWHSHYERQIYERSSPAPNRKRIHAVWSDHLPKEQGQLDDSPFRRISGHHL